MAYATEYLLADDAAYAFVSGVTARSGSAASPRFGILFKGYGRMAQ